MISVILKIDSFERVKKALSVLGDEKKKLEAQVKELEEVHRHPISYESLILAQQTSTLNAVNIALSELVQLVSEVNSDFLVIQDAASMISASQPYNAGSRENY
jgi:hypothetical protein